MAPGEGLDIQKGQNLAALEELLLLAKLAKSGGGGNAQQQTLKEGISPLMILQKRQAADMVAGRLEPRGWSVVVCICIGGGVSTVGLDARDVSGLESPTLP